jgi:hypothetical protein
LWNETTAEKTHTNLKKLNLIRSCDNHSRKYYCPECEQPSKYSELEIISNEKDIGRRLFLSAYAQVALQIKTLRAAGVITDTKENILKLLPEVDQVYSLVLRSFENAEIYNDVRGGNLKSVSGTLCHLASYTLDGDRLKEEPLGVLTFQYEIKSNRISVKWKTLNRDSWSDPVSYIAIHRDRAKKRSILAKNYVPPKTRIGSDGKLYVSYPTVDGKKMQTIKLDEFMSRPMDFKPNLTFDEFLQMLCDTETVTLAPQVSSVSLEEEPLTDGASSINASIEVEDF